jgi:3-methylfumaryl-CoA hydratase
MWASSQLRFHQPLRVGDSIARPRESKASTKNPAAAASSCFVKVKHEVRANGAPEPALTEFHDIVYRDAPKPGDVAAAAAARAAANFEKKWVPDDVLLFRYSGADVQRPPHPLRPALRHRGRGLRGLIVHGPLQATLLHDPAALAASPKRASRRSSSAQSVRSSTCIPFSVCGAPLEDGKTFHLWTARPRRRRHDGRDRPRRVVSPARSRLPSRPGARRRAGRG